MFDVNSLKELVTNQDNLKEYLTEEARKDMLDWVVNKVIPTGVDFVSALNTELSEIAKTETGWNKIRDGVLLPGVFSVGLWFVGKISTYVKNQSEKSAE